MTNGTVLVDRLGSARVTVEEHRIALTIPPKQAVVLVPQTLKPLTDRLRMTPLLAVVAQTPCLVMMATIVLCLPPRQIFLQATLQFH
jgi:hypothetical protein